MATVDRDTFRTLLDEARHAPGGTDLDGQVPLCWLDIGLDGLRIEVTWSCFGLSTFALSCPTSWPNPGAGQPAVLGTSCSTPRVRARLRLTFGQEPSPDLLVFAAADGWTEYLAPIDASAEAVRPKVEHVIGGAFGIEPERDEDGDYLLTADPVPVYARLISWRAAPSAPFRPRGRRVRPDPAAQGVERAEPASALREGQPGRPDRLLRVRDRRICSQLRE